MTEISATTGTSILLTGAQSGAGRAVARRLMLAGHRVTGTVDGSTAAAKLRALGILAAYPNLLRTGELRSAMLAAQAEVVVHFAPQLYNFVPQVGVDWTAGLELLEAGTAALVNAAADAGIRYLVFVGYAYAGGASNDVVSESDLPRRTNNPMVRAALDAETTALTSSIPTVALRAGYVYGGESEATVALRDALKASRPLTLGDGHALANWVHVDDLARAIVLTVEQRPANEVFYIADGQPATVRAFTEYFADSMHLTLPGGMPGFVTQLLGMTPPPSTLDISCRVSSAKAAAQLGWQPHYTSYQSGIDQSLLLFRAEEPITR